IGDVCDVCALDSQNDIDKDNICGNIDNCALVANPLQENFDKDLFGDVCDPDIDNDGISNAEDQCDYTPSNFVVGTNGCGKASYVNINEVEFDNLGTDINEFVELYNPTNETITLTGWRIQDSRGRIDIISHGSIDAYGYFVFSESLSTLDFLNNDSIRIYDLNGSLIDETPFLLDNADDDRTWQREPDAGEQWRFGLSTMGKNNNADITKPIVTLLLPIDNALIENSSVAFSYTAIDDKALVLDCGFYGNFDSSFRKWANETTVNGTINDFFAWDIPDGTYIWNIKCSDGSNEAFTSTNRTIIVNNPDAPVFTIIGNKTLYENETLIFSVNATDADEDNLTYSALNLPMGASFTSQIFSWQPSFSQAGSYNVTFVVSDSKLETRMNVSIKVLDENQAPQLVQDIPNKYFDEDSYVEINLSEYFSDLDGDALTYKLENNTNIKASFNGNIARLNATKEWSGYEELVLVASDSEFEIKSNVFTVVVLPVNDAPVLKSIVDISVSEGQIVRINANASDVDNENLTYSINDTESRFIQLENVFNWETSYSDSGTYYFNVSVSDGLLEDSKIVKVSVIDINEPPHFNPIENITIEEDSGWTSLNISAYDNDGNVTSYAITAEDLNKVDCRIDNSGLLEVKPNANFYGSAYCQIQAKDNSNSIANVNVSIQVNNVNDAPIIKSWSPLLDNIKITEDGSQMFSVISEDIDNNQSELGINWYVGGDLVFQGQNYMFNADGNSTTYNISVVVDDKEFFVARSWILETSDKPLTEKYNGDTTNFDTANLSSTRLILEKAGIGKIEFLDYASLENVVDLDRYSEILRGTAGIDTNIFSSLKNKKARITFYNMVYDKTPAIYYKSSYDVSGSGATLCPSNICSEITNANNQVSFLVSGFSTYFVGDTLTCSQKSGFLCSASEICLGNVIEAKEAGTCCSQRCQINFADTEMCKTKNSNILVEIKDPDDGDKFSGNETISGTIQIKNEFSDERDFDYKIVLYDLAGNKEVETIDDSITLDNGDRENIDFSFDNIDLEKEEYYIYALARDSGNESFCNDQYIKVQLERDKHSVVVDVFDITGNLACGEWVYPEIRVKNIGKTDEDVTIVLENSELGINQKSDKFNLDKAGGDDSKKERFAFMLGENVSGNYTLTTRVIYYNELRVEKTIQVNCIKPEIRVQEIVQENLGTIRLNKQAVKNSFFEDLQSIDPITAINIILIVLIILIFIVIIALAVRRTRVRRTRIVAREEVI
ncbi:MAG: Ig-like domain-containing protein, partial [Candidatus Pacearchaeota archaeon]|nr:Ig-like domain-containing protein [Candidatus Pacearchaeota archaeon]